MKKFFKLIFGYCGYCEKWFVWPKRRRTNTAYMDDDLNFETSCKSCYDEHGEYWQDQAKVLDEIATAKKERRAPRFVRYNQNDFKP